MTEIATADFQPETPARRPRHHWRSHPFNYRVMIARFIIYGVALYVASLILPGFVIKPFQGREVYSVLMLAAIFGIINAVFKPALQYLALAFLLQTIGVVVVLVNIAVFALLDAFAGSLMELEGFWWYIVGGILVGFLAFVLENVFGVPQPILSDIPPESDEVTA